jgi:acyl-coenzyme A synthetase/AMP-(fatty) acid ligase
VSHPDISDAAVIGIPDDEAGELPRAYVVTKGNVSQTDVIKFVEENVAPYKKLRGGVEFIDEIPRSLSGKILRRELKQKFTRTGEKANETSTTRRNTVTKNNNYGAEPVRTSSCCVII